MSFKGFANSEIDIFKKSIEDKVQDMKDHPEAYDADVIGSETLYSEKMENLLDNLKEIMNILPRDISKDDLQFLSGCLDNISNGYPLSYLNEYDEDSEEWAEFKSNVYVNTRYQFLYRRRITVLNEKNEEVTKDIYSDFDRFNLFNIINNKDISIEDTGVGFQLQQMLDQMFPITFPYNPKEEKIKLMVEIFEINSIKILSLTHYAVGNEKKYDRIMKFFDISKGVMYEIPIEKYIEYKQEYEKAEAEKESE